MAIYTVLVENPIVGQEVMRIQTDNLDIARAEAAYYSRRHGIARIIDEDRQAEVTRFRYGSERAYEA